MVVEVIGEQMLPESLVVSLTVSSVTGVTDSRDSESHHVTVQKFVQRLNVLNTQALAPVMRFETLRK
jgi:hypothetical protein